MIPDYETLMLSLNGAIFSKIVYLVLGIILFRLFFNKIRCDPYFAKWSEQFPGPRPLPWFGNSLALRKSGIKRADKLLSYEKIYGPLYRLWFSSKNLVVVIADVKHLEIVYSSSKMFDKPPFMNHGKDTWADSLFLADKSVWKKIRCELQPTLAKNMVNRKIQRYNQIVNKYVERVENLANGKNFEIGKIFILLVFDLITEVLFDIPLQYPDEDIIALHYAMKNEIYLFEEKVYRPWLRSSIGEFIAYRGQIKHGDRSRDHFYEKVIERSKLANSDEENFSFLQVLEKIKKQFNFDENFVNGEFFEVFDAGNMATMTFLSICMLMLAMHPEIQEKLFQEIKENIKSEDPERNFLDDVCRLPYLDQIIKETLRRFLLFPGLFRNVDEDVKIGPYVLPAGTAIVIPVYNLHMNPKYYKNPTKFDPDHFSPTAVRERPKFAYLPFSHGVKYCIGKPFAELTMKLTIVALIRRFKFHSSSKYADIDAVLNIDPVGENEGYFVKAQIRENNTQI